MAHTVGAQRILVGVVVAAGLVACSRGGDAGHATASPAMVPQAEAVALDAAGGAPAAARGVAEMAAAAPAVAAMNDAPSEQMLKVAAPAVARADVARMIVRSARVSLQVADVRRAVQEVTALTSGAKGFLGDSRFWRDGDADRASMTLRVPSDALDATLGRLRGLAVRVEDESMSGEDVTRQAVDLGAQLTNLRATEAELRALLVTVRQNAKRASEVLEVHQELTNIRGQIEQHTAELQSLTQLAAMSTITLEIRPDVVAVPVADRGWQPKGVLRDAVRALLATGHVLVDGAIWAVVYALPLLLLAGAFVMALLSAWRAVRRRRAPVAPIAG